MRTSPVLTAFLAGALLATPACAAELVVTVDTGTEMPLARIEGGRVVEGVHVDLGRAIAKRLGRKAVFHVLPRKRLVYALEEGDADLLCMYVPEWLPGAVDWSKPFFPMAEVVASDQRGPKPASLRALAGQPIGAVHGYLHGELEQVLGGQFVRQDGPSVEINLQKMALQRVRHVITSDIFIHYRLRHGQPAISIHEPLVVKSFKLQCAVSRRGRVTVAQVDKAIAAIVRDGTVQDILARYRR
jgi:polar amino acid transport system substrate-binding protein